MNELTTLWQRTRELERKKGLMGLTKAAGAYLIRPFFAHEQYCLIERLVRAEQVPAADPPRAGVRELGCFVVRSNKEADQLEEEGFCFRSFPTDWNYGQGSYRRWLNRGAIALCTFVGREFAAINWVIPSQEVQKKITLPVKVDYANHEAITRGYWVNPKFRGLGLIKYTVRERDILMAKMGIWKTKGPVARSNVTGLGLSGALGSRQYGTARLLKVLWWQSWKETYDDVPLALTRDRSSAASFTKPNSEYRSPSGQSIPGPR